MKWLVSAVVVALLVAPACGASESPRSEPAGGDETTVAERAWPTVPAEVERLLEGLPESQDGWLRSPVAAERGESFVGWSVEYTRDPDAPSVGESTYATASVSVMQSKAPVSRTDRPVWMLAGLWIWGGCAEAECLDLEASAHFHDLLAADGGPSVSRELDRLGRHASTSGRPWIRFTSTYNVDSGLQLRPEEYSYVEAWGVEDWTYMVETSSSTAREFVLDGMVAAVEAP